MRACMQVSMCVYVHECTGQKSTLSVITQVPCDLKEKSPHQLMYLSTGSVGGGVLWKGYGTFRRWN